jgi:glutamate-1-semialdehyde aminotransferase
MAERILLDEIPPIRRARGFRLYDGAGRRYLDLWQADGNAILGHRGAGMVTAVKAALDRGLAAPS